jgi:hypothetical protein
MLKISLMVWIMLRTALAGTAVIAVAGLADQAMRSIPMAALIGFGIAMPLAYLLATRIGAAQLR